MSWRRHTKWLGILTLIGAAINLPLATHFVSSSRFPLRSRPTLNVMGAAAAKYTWPQPAASGQPPWPPPTRFEVQSEFGHIRYDWRSENDHAFFAMQSDRYGWPLSCLEESNRWWPWDDTIWKSTEMPESPLHVLWTGVLLNPLIFALSIWLIFLGLPAAWMYARARSRRNQYLCTNCAYPLVPSGICPECGMANQSLTAATKTS